MPLEDMSGLDQSLTPQQLAAGSTQQNQQQMSPGTHLAGFERYSRKVFVGGLPPDIDEGLYNAEALEVLFFLLCIYNVFL